MTLDIPFMRAVQREYEGHLFNLWRWVLDMICNLRELRQVGSLTYILRALSISVMHIVLLHIISLLTQLYSQRIMPEKLQNSQTMHLGTHQARRAT